jgi:hypothetical protein
MEIVYAYDDYNIKPPRLERVVAVAKIDFY